MFIVLISAYLIRSLACLNWGRFMVNLWLKYVDNIFTKAVLRRKYGPWTLFEARKNAVKEYKLCLLVSLFTQLFRERLLISHFFPKPTDCSFTWTLVLRVMVNKAFLKVFTGRGRQRSDSSWRNTWGWFHKVGWVASTVADESFCWCETAELPSLSRTRESISHILQQHHPHSPPHCQIYAARFCSEFEFPGSDKRPVTGVLEGWLPTATLRSAHEEAETTPPRCLTRAEETFYS